MVELKLRSLKSTDIGSMCKIISEIGITQFKDSLDVKLLTDKKISNTEKGAEIIFSVGDIILANVTKVQKDVNIFLASLTGKKVSVIDDLSLADYTELIITVIQKDEFKDFFERVMKLLHR